MKFVVILLSPGLAEVAERDPGSPAQVKRLFLVLDVDIFQVALVAEYAPVEADKYPNPGSLFLTFQSKSFRQPGCGESPNALSSLKRAAVWRVIGFPLQRGRGLEPCPKDGIDIHPMSVVLD